MHRHLKTDINYAKLIESQANQETFEIDKKISKKNVKVKTKYNDRAKMIRKTRLS